MMRNSNLSTSSIKNQSDTVFSCPENYVPDQDQEESGWTSYFDDFFSNETPHLSSLKHIDNMSYDDDKDEEPTYNSCGGSGSAVSDAASCAAWNESSQYKNFDDERSNRVRADALASCSSFDATQMVIHKKLRLKRNINMHKKSSDYYDDSLEDTASSPVNSPKAKGEVYVNDHQQGQEIGLKSLKEKGLCLVPYSTLMNYIG